LANPLAPGGLTNPAENAVRICQSELSNRDALLNTGEVIPADGLITEDVASIDQQALTRRVPASRKRHRRSGVRFDSCIIREYPR